LTFNSILYFGSIGVFERAFRANSDFMLVFVFLNLKNLYNTGKAVFGYN